MRLSHRTHDSLDSPNAPTGAQLPDYNTKPRQAPTGGPSALHLLAARQRYLCVPDA